MLIDRITITGADDQTSISDLVKFSDRYPIIEWGILHMEAHQGKPRYPTDAWIEKFLAEIPDNTECSLHLCGRSLTRLKEKWRQMVALCKRFDRIQLNFNARKVGEPFIHELSEIIVREGFIVITQHNEVNKNVWKNFRLKQHIGDYHLLFDGSGGKGLVPLRYAPPFPKHFCGYAGGLTPNNIAVELAKIDAVVPKPDPIWIDMETGVRTNDKLDFEKIERVVKAVLEKNWGDGSIKLPQYRRRPNRGKKNESNIS